MDSDEMSPKRSSVDNADLASTRASPHDHGSDATSVQLLGARVPYGEALTARLEFLAFALANSRLQLAFRHIERLWRDFMEHPLSGELAFSE